MASDPTPEEDIPPRLRFGRPATDAEAAVFRPVRPEPVSDGAGDGSEQVDDDAETPPVDSDAEIIRRFEALREQLREEQSLRTSAAPDVAGAPGDSPGGRGVELSSDGEAEASALGESETLDVLQARIRQARRDEQAVRAESEQAFRAEAPDPEGLTYDELEALKQSEAQQQPGQTKKEKRRKRRKNRSFWQELPILILVALVVAIIIKTFFFQAFYIPSGSMIPTLQINDRVLVNKLSYQFGSIERGDILVFDSPEAIDVERSLFEKVFRSIGEATGLTSPDTVLIKRVVGLPGDTVEIRDGQVYVNGKPIAEPYLPEGISMRDAAEVTVPADHVFLMGDNRNQSRDSRVFGPIPREDIVGRAFVTVWPPGGWGGL